jgi:hypothetical protein
MRTIFIVFSCFTYLSTLNAQCLYKLPFPNGNAYYCSNGVGTSSLHSGAYQHAWDFPMPIGTAITAARGGTIHSVVQSWPDNNCSLSNDCSGCISDVNRIVINHGDGTYALYLHLTTNGSIYSVGNTVTQGQVIGYSGNSGCSSGPHLHFMVMNSGSWWSPTIPISFCDVNSNDGIPVVGSSYTASACTFGPPNASSPANSQINVSTPVNFDWNDISGATPIYRIQVSTSNSGWTPANGFTSGTSESSTIRVNKNTNSTSAFTWNNSAAFPPLPNVTYYWTVKSFVCGMSSNYSPVRSFTTSSVSSSTPAVPILASPSNGATSVSLSPQLSWNAAAGADSYQIQLATNSSFSNSTMVNDASNVTQTSRSYSNLTLGTTYFWRVRAHNTDGFSNWSNVRYFVTQSAASTPPAPTLTSPSNNATGISVNPTLLWGTSQGATSYRVQVATASSFSSTFMVADASNVTNISFLLNGLASNTLYYWRVSASNASGTSAWSATRNFRTLNVITVPAIPTLNSPIHTAQQISTNPTLIWNASPGTTTYHVQLASNISFTTSSIIVDLSGQSGTSRQVNNLIGNTHYYWRVRATNSAGTSDWSAIWNFRTTSATPDPPVLLAPANQAQNISTNPSVSWNATTGATTYNLQVSTNSAFTSPIVNLTGLTATSRQLLALSNNSTFYWRVSATNQAGTGSWSMVWTFSTPTTTPPPPAPVLITPANNAVNQVLNPIFSWNPSMGAVSYVLHVSTDVDFSTLVFNQSGILNTSLQVNNGLIANTRYYWKVRATGSLGSSTWSGVWTFTTMQTAPAPNLISPANNAINIIANPTLSWIATAGASSYTLQVATTNTFTTGMFTNQSNLTATSRVVNGLAPGQTYYWRVRADNSAGASAWSSIWSFQVQALVVIPLPPTLSSPLNLATNITTSPTMSWNASNGATSYQLQVATNGTFAGSTLVFDESVLTGTSLLLNNLTENTLFYWRVRATNTAGTSLWSSIWSFSTLGATPTVPAVPILISPANGAINISTSPPLSWNASSGASSYQLQVATNSSFAGSTLVFDESFLFGTSMQLSGLSGNALHYWRVRATNTAGTSGWSVIRNFSTLSTSISVPTVPVLLSPSNGAINISTSPLLSWNASSGATSYQIQVATSSLFTGSSLVSDQTVLIGISLQLSSLLPNTIYHWRVRAINTAGTSAWSVPRSFSTLDASPTLPAIPILVSPTNGSINISTSPPLSWNATSGASSYHLQIATNTSFAGSSLVFNQSGLTGTSMQLSSLAGNTIHYWRVMANNTAGTSGWSSVWSFSTFGAVPTLPAVPILASPANGASNISTSPPLSWNASSGATTYQIQVATSSSFTGSSMVGDQSGLTGTLLLLSNLPGNTIYFWRVRATNSVGTSVWSAVWSFSTIVSNNSVPPPPTLSFPVNNTNNIDQNTMLSWNAANGATRYTIQVSTDVNFSTFTVNESGITILSSQVNGLQSNTLYYWRVKAGNLFGDGPWSAVWNFSTIGGGQPLPPSPLLISPANYATQIPLSHTLLWSPTTSAIAYQLQLSFSADFSTGFDYQLGQISSFQFDLPILNTVMFWRVRARNNTGYGPWSEAWRFTTISSNATLPSAPTLFSPANNAINMSTNPTLLWNAVFDANHYELEVSGNNTFTNLIIQAADLLNTSFVLSGLPNNTTFYWRVRASNAAGNSAWSTVRNFRTMSSLSLPLVPVLLAPTNNTQNTPTSTTLVWSASGSNLYHVQVASTPDFTDPIMDDTGISSTTRFITGLSYNTIYYWRVRAVNNSGTSAWSTVFNFHTLIFTPSLPEPVTPFLSFPQNVASNIATDVTLSWFTAEFASTYTLQLATTISFASPIVNLSNISSTSYPIGGLSNNTTYYWRVRASNDSGNSAWSRIWSFTTVNQAIGRNPVDVSLSTDCLDWIINPNPMDQSTYIQFILPENTHIRLSIRSHSGQQVALLVDDRLNSGSHHFTWSPADLPPGVYMAVLQTGKTIETKKIIKQ